MKHLKLFESFSEIESICRKYGITNYTINSDGSVDVNGDVYLSNEGLTKLPLKFNIVSGGFYCFDNKLTSLEGAPKEVGGHFDCSYNELKSLEGAPKEVGGSFDYNDNLLPKNIGHIKANIKYVIKNQDDYSIWKSDDTLDLYRFNQMMEDED